MGTAHCGSTLLTLILGSHSDCLALGEISNLPRFYRKNKPICSICQGDCHFWNHNFSSQERQLLSQGFSDQRIHPSIPLKLEKTVRGLLGNDRVFNPYSLIFSKVNKNVLIDSTKTVYWLKKKLVAKEFKENLIEAYLIHLIRDGRAVMSSYLTRNQDMTVKQFSELWVKRINDENNFFNHSFSGKKIELRYEEFATKTAETIKNLCEWLDLDFQPEMINYWQHEHHIISGNTGTRSLIDKYQSRQQIKKSVKTQDQQKSYQEERDFHIELDCRWKTRLSSQQIAEFSQITGDLNKSYEWN